MTNLTNLKSVALAANTNSGETQTIVKGGRFVEIHNIQKRGWVRGGQKHQGETLVGHHADVVIGDSVVLHGVETNHIKGPFQYASTFQIGDSAEYDSYNLSYTGTIRSITAKGVTIVAYEGSCNEKAHRLDWAEFSWRNRHFDSTETFERNSEMMMTL